MIRVIFFVVFPLICIIFGLPEVDSVPCFQCRDRCITYSWRCDGEIDCLSGEDERDCEYVCPYQTHHRCSDTGLCIENFHLCDGHYDCLNGEDEINCSQNSWVGNRGQKRFSLQHAKIRQNLIAHHAPPKNSKYDQMGKALSERSEKL